jgi:hypothetical protein
MWVTFYAAFVVCVSQSSCVAHTLNFDNAEKRPKSKNKIRVLNFYKKACPGLGLKISKLYKTFYKCLSP